MNFYSLIHSYGRYENYMQKYDYKSSYLIWPEIINTQQIQIWKIQNLQLSVLKRSMKSTLWYSSLKEAWGITEQTFEGTNINKRHSNNQINMKIIPSTRGIGLRKLLLKILDLAAHFLKIYIAEQR